MKKHVLTAAMAGFLMAGSPLLQSHAIAQSAYEPPANALRGEVNGTRIAFYAPVGHPIGNFIVLVYFDTDAREWRGLWTSEPIPGEAQFATLVADSGGANGFLRKNMNDINDALAKKFPGGASQRPAAAKPKVKSVADDITREAAEKFKFQVAPDGTVKLVPK